MSSALARSRKSKVAQELLCERVYRPLAHLVVSVLLPLRVPPPFVAVTAGATGITAAVQLAQGKLLLAAILIQAKTILDNANGQLARLSGHITVFGRYLDSELDLFVNAALFAGVAVVTGRPALAAAGFVALTIVLSVNYNGERLYRAEHGEEVSATPEADSRAAGFLRSPPCAPPARPVRSATPAGRSMCARPCSGCRCPREKRQAPLPCRAR